MTRFVRKIRDAARRYWNGFRFFRQCERCGCGCAQHYHQNTSYVREELNWVSLCRECSRENDEYWDERWAEYYAGCM